MGNNDLAKCGTEQSSISFNVLVLEIKYTGCQRALHSGRDSVNTYYCMYMLIKEG